MTTNEMTQKTREIKFRGLSINGQWFYGLLSISQGGNGFPEKGYYISNSAGSPWAYQVRSETVGQYIGLHDKNGKEIYEGDILKVSFIHGQTNHICVVKWDAKYALFKIEPGRHEYGLTTLKYSSHDTVFGHEVIGNIYENPELMEKK